MTVDAQKSLWCISEEILRSKRGVKWTEFGPTILPSWIAEMDFTVAPAIRAALQESLSRSDLGYPAGADYDAVREGFAERYGTLHGCLINPEEVEILSDVMQGLFLSVYAFTEPEDFVGVLTPIYPPFIHAIEEMGRRVAAIPLVDGAGPDGGFGIDLEATERIFSSTGAKLLLLCNPHNPTGRAFTLEELENLGTIVRRHGGVIASDEVHSDLVLDGARHTSILQCSEPVRAGSLVLYSASKAFAIPGVACGVAGFGSADMRTTFRSFPEHARGAPGALSMRATVAAWKESGTWLDGARGVLLQNRNLLRSRLERECPDLRVVPQEATFLAWINGRDARLTSCPSEYLLSSARVAVSPGSDFGPEYADFFRLNFATSPDILAQILDRIAVAMAETSGRRS